MGNSSLSCLSSVELQVCKRFKMFKKYNSQIRFKWEIMGFVQLNETKHTTCI